MIAARKRPGSSEPKRMTPAAIRAATPFPKPKGAIETALASGLSPLDSPERRLLGWIAEHADIIDAGPDALISNRDRYRHWLLVPLSRVYLNILASFEADRADLEPDDELEPVGDDEPEETDDDRGHEDNGDDEPSVVYPGTMERDGLDNAEPSPFLAVRQSSYRERTGYAPFDLEEHHRQHAKYLAKMAATPLHEGDKPTNTGDAQ